MLTKGRNANKLLSTDRLTVSSSFPCTEYALLKFEKTVIGTEFSKILFTQPVTNFHENGIKSMGGLNVSQSDQPCVSIIEWNSVGLL